jgi:hypothetical protein
MKRSELLAEMQKRQAEMAGICEATADANIKVLVERMLRGVEQGIQSMNKLELSGDATSSEIAMMENSARVFEIVMGNLRKLPTGIQSGVAGRLYFYLQIDGLNLSVAGGAFAHFFQLSIWDAIRSKDASLLRQDQETICGRDDFLFFTLGVTDAEMACAIAIERLTQSGLHQVMRIAIFEPETNAFRVLSEDPQPIRFEDCLSRVDAAIKEASE